jgi:hypothetical protein
MHNIAIKLSLLLGFYASRGLAANLERQNITVTVAEGTTDHGDLRLPCRPTKSRPLGCQRRNNDLNVPHCCILDQNFRFPLAWPPIRAFSLPSGTLAQLSMISPTQVIGNDAKYLLSSLFLAIAKFSSSRACVADCLQDFLAFSFVTTNTLL